MPAVQSMSVRERTSVRYADVVIDTIIDRPAAPAVGGVPSLVMLPSLGRDSEDFDEVATGLASAGLTVLRPQPRGILGSRGPLEGITQHEFARDIAEVITTLGGGRAAVAGHAYGNWVARQTATDFPDMVAGVILIAAAARNAPGFLGQIVTDAGDPSLPEARRLEALRIGFFAPGHDPTPWLAGWHPAVKSAQRTAAQAVPRDEWWPAGSAPILDLQAEHDPFMPPKMRMEMRQAYGDRVTQRLIRGASHSLIPERPAEVVDEISRWIAAL